MSSAARNPASAVLSPQRKGNRGTLQQHQELKIMRQGDGWGGVLFKERMSGHHRITAATCGVAQAAAAAW